MASIGGISFTGLASGLDTRAIINALLNAERIPVGRMESRRSGFQAQRDAWNRVDSLLQGLQTAAGRLTGSAPFDALQVVQDSESSLLASLGGDPPTGSWQIEVLGLASAQSNASTGQADRSQTVYTGAPITFENANGEISMNFDGMTLDEIAAAINAETELRVHATVVDDGSGSNPYRLVLTAADTGADNAFSISIDSSGDTAGSVGDLFQSVSDGATNVASNAKVTIDGVEAKRSTNRMDDLIPGLTLDLVALGTTRVEVRSDPDVAVESMQEFVAAYQALVDATSAQTDFDPDTGKRGVLFGDPTLRGVLFDLRQGLSRTVSNSGNARYTMGAFVGIDVDRNGNVSFDEEEFRRALADDPDAVAGLIGGTDGLVTGLGAQLDQHLSSVDGTLAIRLDGLDDRIDNIGDSIDRTERRIGVLQTQLESRFAALETLLGRLQQQSLSLSSFSS